MFETIEIYDERMCTIVLLDASLQKIAIAILNELQTGRILM